MEKFAATKIGKRILAWALVVPSAYDSVFHAGSRSDEDPNTCELEISAADILKTIEKWQWTDTVSQLLGEGKDDAETGEEVVTDDVSFSSLMSEVSDSEDFSPGEAETEEYVVEKEAPPIVVHDEQGVVMNDEEREPSEAFELRFQLDKDLIHFVEETLVLPYDQDQSIVMKKALLESLETKWLVKTFDEADYQAIVVLDSHNYELSVAFINNSEKELKFKLKIVDSSGNPLELTEVSAMIQKATKKTLTEEELNRYKYASDAQVEVLSLSVTELAEAPVEPEREESSQFDEVSQDEISKSDIEESLQEEFSEEDVRESSDEEKNSAGSSDDEEPDKSIDSENSASSDDTSGSEQDSSESADEQNIAENNEEQAGNGDSQRDDSAGEETNSDDRQENDGEATDTDSEIEAEKDTDINQDEPDAQEDSQQEQETEENSANEGSETVRESDEATEVGKDTQQDEETDKDQSTHEVVTRVDEVEAIIVEKEEVEASAPAKNRTTMFPQTHSCLQPSALILHP